MHKKISIFSNVFKMKKIILFIPKRILFFITIIVFYVSPLWSQILDNKENDITLQYSRDVEEAIGIASELYIACRWDASDLLNMGIKTGMTISSVSIGYGQGTCLFFTLKIWQGGSWGQGPATEIFSKEIDVSLFESFQWNEIIINDIITIDASQMLWVGYHANVISGYPYGCDLGPIVKDKYSNCIAYSNITEWYSLNIFNSDLIYNWCIRVSVNDSLVLCEPINNLVSKKIEENSILLSWSEPDNDSIVSGYKIYRNNQLLTEELVTTNSYLDEILPDGEYEYYVITFYENGCISDSSNHVKEVIEVECEPINNLTLEKCSANCVLLAWSKQESLLEVEGYSIFRNEELQNTELLNDTIYLDNNLPNGNYEYFVITNYTNGCLSDSSNHVKEVIEIGIEDFSEIDGIKIYPNPTTGEVTIMNNEQLTMNNIEVFDIYGRKLTPHTTHLIPHTSLDISHLQAGIYFVKIQTKKGIITKKTIKL